MYVTQVNLDGFALPIKKLKGTEPVETLNLSRKGLGVLSAIVIAKLIEFNAVLKKLSLEDCEIYDEGATALAEGLKANTSLKDLNLNNCGIGTEGGKALAAALHVVYSHTRNSYIYHIIS